MGERVFALPDLGEGLEEGRVISWLVAEGDEVALNQPLVEVETAKATVEIPSPFAGRVAKLHAANGDIVPVGSPLLAIEVAGAAGPVPAAPATRKLARDLGVDLEGVGGSGPHGRVTPDDVRRAAGAAAPAVRAARRSIAANLETQAAIPQVTTFRTVDCSELELLRRDRGLSPLPVFVAALCRTIAGHPRLNATWDGTAVIDRGPIHAGIAVETDRGLVVPVICDAGDLRIADLAAEIRRLAEGARQGRLQPSDLGGATVAVSNTGSYGSEAGTPILAPGTAVTMAVGVIAPRALVVDDAVVARPACTLSTTFDHRVLDGASIGRALTDLVELMQSQERLRNLPR